MNIREIARIANVTPGTVSKVLNNYPDISEATRAHVKSVIEEHQYTPRFGSRFSESLNHTPTVGLVIEGVYNDLYSDIHQMLSNKLHNAEYTIMSYSDNYFVQDKNEKFEELLKYSVDHKLDGFIYMGGNFEEVSEEQFNKLPCPTIFMDTVLPASYTQTNYSSVQTNNYECGLRQMQLLIAKGHENISMMISSKDDNSIYGLRYKGYLKALADAGLTGCLENVVEGQYVAPRTYNELKKFLASHPEITAVCVSADIMAPAVLRVIYDLGKIPGKDIDIISFDGLEMLDYTFPRVTAFGQPKAEMVETTYDLLMGLISGQKTHQHITFQNLFIQRETLL